MNCAVGSIAAAAACMLLKVPPVVNPACRAALSAAICENAPPATPGAIGIFPFEDEGASVQLVTVGGFASTLVDSCAGYKSLKIPIPPRMTVFPLAPPGVQANPPRG